MSGNDKKQPHAGQIGTLSESLEDYLEIILDLQQLKRVARIRDIAARKGVASASVSGALSRLARDGYVVHEAHEFVELTEKGRLLAGHLLNRHQFLTTFLRDVLQVSPSTAEDDACAIEHHLSAETIGRIELFERFLSSLSHGLQGGVDGFREYCQQHKLPKHANKRTK